MRRTLLMTALVSLFCSAVAQTTVNPSIDRSLRPAQITWEPVAQFASSRSLPLVGLICFYTQAGVNETTGQEIKRTRWVRGLEQCPKGWDFSAGKPAAPRAGRASR